MYTGLQLCEKILSETKVPMECDAIWKYAVQKGYDKECGVGGKTPWNTLGSQLYVNIRDRSDTKFIQISKRPATFGLKSINYDTSKVAPTPEENLGFKERDLHALLVSFLYSNSHFKSHTKTIYHESSSKSSRNAERWMHPDLVSVHFPFEDFEIETVGLLKNSGQMGTRIFSFEMKRSVTVSNVRECFFQAVSNSSWANEGYLVALEFNEGALEQLSHLCASFSIGVIRLNSEDVHQSEILIPSRESEVIDMVFVDDLLKVNPDFKEFISSINDSMATSRVIDADYDAVLSDEALEEHIAKKRISVM